MPNRVYEANGCGIPGMDSHVRGQALADPPRGGPRRQTSDRSAAVDSVMKEWILALAFASARVDEKRLVPRLR